MAFLGLLRFAPVRAALLWLVRSRLGRRAIRAGLLPVGRLILRSLAGKR
jgi:hypothetical protein